MEPEGTLIKGCVDPKEALLILKEFDEGNRVDSLRMVKEHLKKCKPCREKFQAVSKINCFFNGGLFNKKESDHFHSLFIISVKKQIEYRQNEYISAGTLYQFFMNGEAKGINSKDMLCSAKKEVPLAEEFYWKLMDFSVNGSEKASVPERRPVNKFVGFAVTAAAVLLLTVQIVSSGIEGSSSAASVLKANVFSVLGGGSNLTPLESSTKKDNASLQTKFGLPVDDELENFYKINYPENSDYPSFFTVSMNKGSF